MALAYLSLTARTAARVLMNDNANTGIPDYFPHIRYSLFCPLTNRGQPSILPMISQFSLRCLEPRLPRLCFNRVIAHA